MMSRLFRALWRDIGGVSALEFALILPAMLLVFFGIIEVAVVFFIGATLESSVSQAARFGITGGETGAGRVERVREIVAARTYGLIDMDAIMIDTLVYEGFADIGRPEPFTDQNGNGVHDAGEPFTDVNGTGHWEADMGRAGLGDPSDVVVYRLRHSWGIMTPLIADILGESIEHVSSVAVRNEPF